MSKRIFHIDFDVLVEILIPTCLRLAKMKAWLKVLISPLKTLYSIFKANRENNVYELTHSAQVCHIEAVLNDRYDTAMRRIKVLDGISIQPFWAGDDNINSDYAGHSGDPDLNYAPHDADLLNGNDAVIEVPSVVAFDVSEMKALIDKYRLSGKHNYKIVIV